jgi:hypothetical protein
LTNQQERSDKKKPAKKMDGEIHGETSSSARISHMPWGGWWWHECLVHILLSMRSTSLR